MASAWKVYQQADRGWGKVIAPGLPDFLRTLVETREAYGTGDGHPADWWAPCATDGTRYDLE